MTEITSTLEYLQVLASMDSPIEKFVLEHGSPLGAPVALSQYGIERKLLNDCFKSAHFTALSKGLVYCEGFAKNLVPVHHAWCIDPLTLETVDPTWEQDGSEYFGVMFNYAYQVMSRNRHENYSLLDNLNSPLSVVHNPGMYDFKWDAAW